MKLRIVRIINNQVVAFNRKVDDRDFHKPLNGASPPTGTRPYRSINQCTRKKDERAGRTGRPRESQMSE
jgi:hypothetical protein